MKNKTSPARRPLTRFTSSLCGVGLASLALNACAGFDSGVEDLGSTDAVSQDLDTAVDEPFYTSPAEFSGRWIGVADDVFALGVAAGESLPAYRFPSGATSIVLDLEVIEDQYLPPNVVGTVTFGAGEPPPPPTDPNVGYPVGLSYSDLYSYDTETSGLEVNADPSPLPPLEGFVYSIAPASFYDLPPSNSVQDGVLQLTYSSGEYLAPWCELQTPVPDGRGGYGCIAPHDQLSLNEGQCFLGYQDRSACPPDLDQLPLNEQALALSQCLQTRDEPIDCDRLFLCSGFAEPASAGRCACDETSCRKNDGSAVYSDDAIMTQRRNGDELVGVITGGLFLNPRGLRTPLGAIRFQRAP